MLLGVPVGLVVGANPASAACYVDASDGGLEPAPNFQDQGSCEEYAGGYWL